MDQFAGLIHQNAAEDQNKDGDKNKDNVYYNISHVNEHLIIIQGEFNTTSALTFKQAFNLIEFDDGEPFGKLKE